jgi:hypothetical protein
MTLLLYIYKMFLVILHAQKLVITKRVSKEKDRKLNK